VDNAADLRALLVSRHPLIFAKAPDEPRLMSMLRSEAQALRLPVWTWSAARGLARDGNRAQPNTRELAGALGFAEGVPAPVLFVLCDAHHALGEPAAVRKLKELSQEGTAGRTFVVTSAEAPIPQDLRGVALSWELRPPGPQELTDLVRRTLQDLGARGVEVRIDEAGVEGLVRSLRGLSTGEAEHLIQRAALDGSVDDADLRTMPSRKAELFAGDGILELIEADAGTLDEVGGLEGLKSWLSLRGRALEPEARGFGLDPPRGVLLTGVPGCGKSFVAKTLARTWGLPLLLLDPGRLYGPYIGESEQRLASALRSAEAMAPAVLWVDEIEKGFAAGGRADSGVSERVRATFLRWMQDRPDGIFVVATANDVAALPPEFTRKGRFDEIFFVDLPTAAEREQILRLHVSKRKRDPDRLDLAALAGSADGFSGAELEAAVVAALYRAYAEGTDLTTEAIAEELARTVPLSRARAEDVAALRAWGAERAVPAGA